KPLRAAKKDVATVRAPPTRIPVPLLPQNPDLTIPSKSEGEKEITE
uniref:Uncharacterized protein n=1 Tax=Parascaris univalens TaxID=6257 RepID=A0A915BG93_PARUN